MKKALKIFLWAIVTLIILLGVLMAGFFYKAKNGFPISYETDEPTINFPTDQPAVLLFSKSTGFRHASSIDTAKIVFAELAKRNNWFLYDTEEGGVFNPEQLAKFGVVIFNNSTGPTLNDEQKKNLQEYVENGGSLIGIHGAGDDSHHWEWYEQNLTGAKFSHHPIKAHLQQTEVMLETVPDSTLLNGLPPIFTHTEEWYVFFESPRANGFNVLYTIDGEKIIPDGNFLWITDKNFGMGKDHPVAWYKTVGKGRTFYTSMGHDQAAWKQQAFIKLMENAVNVTR